VCARSAHYVWPVPGYLRFPSDLALVVVRRFTGYAVKVWPGVPPASAASLAAVATAFSYIHNLSWPGHVVKPKSPPISEGDSDITDMPLYGSEMAADELEGQLAILTLRP
jgi:hypothetical protein